MAEPEGDIIETAFQDFIGAIAQDVGGSMTQEQLDRYESEARKVWFASALWIVGNQGIKAYAEPTDGQRREYDRAVKARMTKIMLSAWAYAHQMTGGPQ